MAPHFNIGTVDKSRFQIHPLTICSFPMLLLTLESPEKTPSLSVWSVAVGSASLAWKTQWWSRCMCGKKRVKTWGSKKEPKKRTSLNLDKGFRCWSHPGVFSLYIRCVETLSFLFSKFPQVCRKFTHYLTQVLWFVFHISLFNRQG